MATKKKKPFWAKFLSAVLVVSMLIGNAGMSSFAASDSPDEKISAEETVVEESAENREVTAETPETGTVETDAETGALDAEENQQTSEETDVSDLEEEQPEMTEGDTLPGTGDDDTKPDAAGAENGEVIPGVSDTDTEETDVVVPSDSETNTDQTTEDSAETPAEVDAEPAYATLEEFLAAVAAVGEVSEAEDLLTAIDICLDMYGRLSPEDKEAQSETYAYIAGYREQVAAGNPDEGIDAQAANGQTTIYLYLNGTSLGVRKTIASNDLGWSGQTLEWVVRTCFPDYYNTSDNYKSRNNSYGYWSGSRTTKINEEDKFVDINIIGTGNQGGSGTTATLQVRTEIRLENVTGTLIASDDGTVQNVTEGTGLDVRGYCTIPSYDKNEYRAETFAKATRSKGGYWKYTASSTSQSGSVEGVVISSKKFYPASGENKVTVIYTVSQSKTETTYILNYNGNGGTPERKRDTATTTDISWTFRDFPNAVRTGYTFDGWYTASYGGTKVTQMTCDTANKEKTVYAHWTKTENPYTIIWKDGYTDNPLKTVENVLYTNIASAIESQKPGNPARDGFTFDGWGAPVYDHTNRTVTVTALWEKNPEQPDISVTKIPEKTEYTAGADVSWNITVTNNGDSSVSGLKLEDILKKDNGSFTGDVIISAPGNLNGTKDSFALDGKDSVTFKATIEEAAAGTYSNAAVVKKGNDELDSYTAEDVVVKATTKTVDRPVTFNILFRTTEGSSKNLEQSDVSTDFKLILTYTDGAGDSYEKVLTYADAQKSVSSGYPMLTWNPITIKVPDEKGARVKINVKQEGYIVGNNDVFIWQKSWLADGGKMEEGTGVAYASRASYDTKVWGHNYYSLPKDTATTNVNVEKTANKETVVAGDNVVYTITVTNVGSDTARNVTVKDVLDNSKLEFVSWKLNDGAENSSAPVDHVYQIGNIEKAQSSRLYITAKVKNTVTSGDKILNTATADYENKPDKDPGTLESVKEITVVDEAQYTVRIQYVDDSEPVRILQEETIATLKDGESYNISGDKVLEELVVGENHYVKDGEPSGALTGTINGSDILITIPYTLDNIGTDPENPDQGDKIPDKYQAIVTYRAVNGTLNGPVKAVVTLKNENGDFTKAEEGGFGYLAERQIPVAAPNEGYGNGSWIPAEPVISYRIDGDMEFVITYSGNTPTDPETPAPEPTPTPDPTPGPTPTPDPTPGPAPTPDPTPGPAPTPDPTPGPAPTPDPTPAPEPTPIIPGPVPTVGPTTVVPTVTPVVPAQTEPTPTAALASLTPETTELMDEEVPLAAGEEEADPETKELDEEAVPLAAGKGAAWALINFALMNLAVFESLMLLIGYFIKTKGSSEEEDDEEKKKLKKKGIMRIISLLVAVISVIAFILTEDITLPTAFVDRYTILMAIIAIVQTVVVWLSRKEVKDEEQEVRA